MLESLIFSPLPTHLLRYPLLAELPFFFFWAGLCNFMSVMYSLSLQAFASSVSHARTFWLCACTSVWWNLRLRLPWLHYRVARADLQLISSAVGNLLGAHRVASQDDDDAFTLNKSRGADKSIHGVPAGMKFFIISMSLGLLLHLISMS